MFNYSSEDYSPAPTPIYFQETCITEWRKFTLGRLVHILFLA